MGDSAELMTAHVTVTADTAPVDKGLESIKGKMKQVGDEADHAEAKTKTFLQKLKSQLEEVKQSAGRRSGIGEIAETLRGAGAIAGVAAIADMFAKAADKAKDLAVEFHEGNLSGVEMAGGIAKSLPVLGSMIEGFQTIGGLIDGSIVKDEERKRKLEDQNELLTRQAEIANRVNDLRRAENVKTKSAQDEVAIAMTPAGVQRQAAQIQNQSDQRVADLMHEMSPQAITQRKQAAVAPLEQERDKRLAGISDRDADQKVRVTKLYQGMIDAAMRGAADEAEAIKTANPQIINAIRAATDAQLRELENGEKQTRDIELAADRAGAISPQAKIEAFKDEKAHEGFKPEAYLKMAQAEQKLLDVQASVGSANKAEQLGNEARAASIQTLNDKIAENRIQLEQQAAKGEIAAGSIDQLSDSYKRVLEAAAAKGSVDMLESLNKEFASESARTFAEKVAANREELQRLAEKGNIAAGSIDKLNAAYARNLQVEVDAKIRDAADALAEVGKSDIQKQVDAFAKIAANAEQAAKFAQLLTAAATAQKVVDLNRQTAAVGMNPLDAARAQAAQGGMDPTAVGNATGQLLGAQLTDEMRTPFQQFGDTIAYYRELLDKGDISQQTFLQLQSKAFSKIADKGQSVEEHAMQHLQGQFASIPGGVASYADAHQYDNETPEERSKRRHKEENDKYRREHPQPDLHPDLHNPAAGKINGDNGPGGPDGSGAKPDAVANATRDNTKALEELTKKVASLTKRLDDGIYGVAG
jgi:hypothetical protein